MDSVVILRNKGGIAVGTGFVLEYSVNIDDDHRYLVTCEHCVEETVEIFFEGKSLGSFDPAVWIHSTLGDDIAILDISDRKEFGDIGLMSFNLNEIVPREKRWVDLGIDLYMIGLLVDDRNPRKSALRVRFGNLSAFSDDNFPMEMGNAVERPCHLADMRSRGGFSGSPVIAYSEFTVLDSTTKTATLLLGIHSAQHPEPIKISGFSEMKTVLLPSGMTRIVPAWCIKELIETDQDLREMRASRQATLSSANEQAGKCD